MIDDEKLKCKIDFLKKKKVVKNVVSFVKPQVPDILGHRVLLLDS